MMVLQELDLSNCFGTYVPSASGKLLKLQKGKKELAGICDQRLGGDGLTLESDLSDIDEFDLSLSSEGLDLLRKSRSRKKPETKVVS